MAVSAGQECSFAIREDGTAWGWGRNDFGEIGDGTTTPRSAPTQVVGVRYAAHVNTSGDHTLMISPTVDHLEFTAQPANGAVHTTLASDIEVTVKRPDGSVVTDHSGPIHIAIKPGTGAEGAVLAGTATAECQDGVASFSGLSIDRPGSGYVFVASSPLCLSGESAPLDIASSAIDRLEFSRAPLGRPGHPLTRPPVVTARYPNGAPAADQQVPVTLSLKPGAGTPGATLSGTVGVMTTDGLATFSDTTIDRPGSGYVMVASSPGLDPVESAPFYVGDWSVAGWGHNGAGQLGGGMALYGLRHAALTDAVQVSTGTDHTIALARDGSVWAWGANSSGQLGDGTRTDRWLPVQVPDLSDVISVSAGSYYSLALKADGTVWGFGQNGYGQLGDGTTEFSRRSPVQVLDISGVVEICAGTFHSLARTSDGDVWAWGSNVSGRLGDGTTTNRTRPVKVANVSNAVSISLGGQSLAATSEGAVWAWPSGGSLVPVQVSGMPEVVSVHAGQIHCLAVTAEGALWSWGNNGYGQLGRGPNQELTYPGPVPGMVDVVSACAGDFVSLTVRQDGSVWAWGRNNTGQMLDGTVENRSAPEPVAGVQGVVDIAAGSGHIVAATGEGLVVGWGSNPAGQFGDGEAPASWSPIPVDGISGVVSVSAGADHSLALRHDGTVWAWGNNAYDQLGVSGMSQRPSPGQVSGLPDIVAVEAGVSHSLALAADGTVWAWGSTPSYSGGLSVVTVPFQVEGLANIHAIRAGYNHSLALRSDGTVMAWGLNTDGQVGDGTTVTRAKPVPVSGLTDAVSISAGWYHSLAVRKDGTVLAWGQNRSGQLGDGTQMTRHTPAPVPGVTGVVSVEAYNETSLALMANGTVSGWGRNVEGQIGDGTNPIRHTSPVSTVGLSDVVNLTLGGFQGHAIQSDGAVWTWGANRDGQNGDGSTAPGLLPHRMSMLPSARSLSAGYRFSLALTDEALPASLGFVSQPSEGQPGVPFDEPPAVEVRYADGSRCVAFNGVITLYVLPGSGATGSRLLGSVTVNAVDGVATFADVSVDRAGTGYLLRAVHSGLAPAVSAPFDVGAGPTWADVGRALRVAGGLEAAGETPVPLDLVHAARLARQVAGLEASP